MASIDSLGNGRWALSNDEVRIEVDASQGGDIRSLVLTETGAELLWRAEPSRSPNLGDDGESGFYDRYPGGIQELFPNAGPATVVQGAPLPFHGEASRVAWEAEHVLDGEGAALRLSVTLRRYPFRLERQIRILPDQAGVKIRSRITNISAQPLPVHWAFHPVFSEVLTRGGVLRGGFDGGVAEAVPFGLKQTYPLGSALPVTVEDGVSRLHLIDGDAGTSDLSYLDTSLGWYMLTGESGHAAALVWPAELFPHIWLWEECHGLSDYPWWGRHHIVGVEPHTAAPASSLREEATSGMALVIEGGGVREVTFVLLATAHVDAQFKGFISDARSLVTAIEEVSEW